MEFPGDVGPVVAQLGLQLKKEVFLGQGPLVSADGAVEVVVVPLATLLSVSMGDAVLSLQQP